MSCQPSVISKIVEVSEGDLRKAITFLQSVSRLKGSEEVTEGDILEIAGVRILVHSGSSFCLVGIGSVSDKALDVFFPRIYRRQVS